MIQNTLYLTTQGAYAHLDHETVVVEQGGTVLIRVPLHHLGALVVLGNVLISPFLIHRCSDDGISISWLTEYGRFKAQMHPSTRGSVLLRAVQHEAMKSGGIAIAQRMVWAKILNQRQVYMRAAREASDLSLKENFSRTARGLLVLSRMIPKTKEMNRLRGLEGMAARAYFQSFTLLVGRNSDGWRMRGRNRRPPRDGINALLSFGYALLRSECQSACETVGLDPQVGYLHVLRPGRPALALDLMEEHRAHYVDRLVLSLVNRGQIRPSDFRATIGGGMEMEDKARKTFLAAYQQRKQDTLRHEAIQQTIPLGAIPMVQAKLLARHLRGDMTSYEPFLYR